MFGFCYGIIVVWVYRFMYMDVVFLILFVVVCLDVVLELLDFLVL